MDSESNSLRVADVRWCNSDEPNYARYFIVGEDKEAYELRPNDFARCELPRKTKSLAKEFEPVFGRNVLEVRAWEHNLYVVLDSGHVISTLPTFDGTTTGNNIELQTPEEVSELWHEFLEMKVVWRPGN